MAIAATWLVNGTAVTTSALLYTLPTTYVRDLVVTNSGSATVFIGLGSGVTSAATTSSFQVPAGGTVILTQCQLPVSGIISAISSGTSSVSIGYGTNISYI